MGKGSLSSVCFSLRVRTCHEPRHKGFSELQDTVVNVLQEGVMREATNGKQRQQCVIAWRKETGREKMEEKKKKETEALDDLHNKGKGNQSLS